MSQRYKLTFEFMLRDADDYESFRKRFDAALTNVVESSIGIMADYLAIEKVPNDPKQR